MIDAGAPRAFFAEIDSTNAEAARRAAAGDFGPVWLRAEAQTAGRGRRGRTWTSRPGNLFLTYFGAFRRAPAELALLSFAAALAVADTADHAVGRKVCLVKWPNDVLLLGRKAAGILLESGNARDGAVWLAIGMGLNVASAPEDAGQPVAALSDAAPGALPSLDQIETVLKRRLAFWAGMLERDGFGPLREAWLARAHGLGGPAVARLGAETVEGVAKDLSPEGALVLELPDARTRLISAGEVVFGAATAA